MHYHLSDHIYVAQFRDEAILLDVNADKYTIYFKEFSALLAKVLEGKPTSFSPQDLPQIQRLIDDNILKTKDFFYPFYIDKKADSSGIANVDWRLPLGNTKIRLNFHVLKALLTLIRVNFYMKFKGFYEVIRLIKKRRQGGSDYGIPSDAELRGLADIVNKACLLYPTRTKCLEWAITYVLLALSRGWRCNLEIGVQNYPFMAHAWVECDEKVIMDSQDLRKGLAIILNEPFRRLSQ
jgi:hypothetical protein